MFDEFDELAFLTSSRLGFRRWHMDVWYQLCIKLWGNHQVSQFITAFGIFSEDQIADRLKKEILSHVEHGIQYWPIFLLVTNEFAGCCGVRPYQLEAKFVEFGCHLLPEFWGCGLVAEAAQTVFGYCFDPLHLNLLDTILSNDHLNSC